MRLVVLVAASPPMGVTVTADRTRVTWPVAIRDAPVPSGTRTVMCVVGAAPSVTTRVPRDSIALPRDTATATRTRAPGAAVPLSATTTSVCTRPLAARRTRTDEARPCGPKVAACSGAAPGAATSPEPALPPWGPTP